MEKIEDLFFPSCDNIHQIHVKEYIPTGKIRGVVQIVHGIAEHIDRYSDFMKFLADNGFVAVGDDHLGHGKSYTSNDDQGFFAAENGWEMVINDLLTLNNNMHNTYPNIPYIMFGHSMGSFLTRTFIIKYPSKYDLVILSGTGHQNPLLIGSGFVLSELLCKTQGANAPGLQLNNIAFGNYLSHIANPRTQFDWLSSVDSVVDAYIEDEHCGFIAKNSLYRDMMKGIQYITNKKNIEKMDKAKPVYFMSGAEDPVGDYGKGVEKVYRVFCDTGIRDVTIRLYPGGRHEMLNEVNKEEVYKNILDWILYRI